jgi:hypothetical protein
MAEQKSIAVDFLIEAIDYVKQAAAAGDYDEIESYCEALGAVAEAYRDDPNPDDPNGQYQKEAAKYKARDFITVQPQPGTLDGSCLRP